MVRIGVFFAIVLPTLAFQATADVKPLPNAHAHNDYVHPRPLLDALDQGFCSVEADVFLDKRGLLIGHTKFDIRPERTLQALYLNPLRERVKRNKGFVQSPDTTFYLLIDVKTDAKETYAALAKVFEEYADILTTTRDGKTKAGAVTIIISGNCDRDAIKAEALRRAAIDGRAKDLNGDEPAALVPWISGSWSSMFKWNGVGPMPEAERKKLRDHVTQAHDRKRLVRFWGTPDTAAAWAEQLDAGVDLINTDRLAELRQFLSKRP